MLTMFTLHAPASPPLKPMRAMSPLLSEPWALRTVNPQPEDEPQSPVEVEALELKDRIRKTHPSSYVSFSLAHMRKVVQPPVQIPRLYRVTRAKSMVVSGHTVPYTKDMWTRAKQKRTRRRLDMIHEHVVYDY